MSASPDQPDYGILLQEWLPAVWRERDGDDGDLGKLLGVYGELLNAFHATLKQRLYDSFPDQDADGHHCQPWLLPYIAQLLDVRLVSPDESGRRAEIADATAWRQRKGTKPAVEAIAEAVGQFEVEIQEGWKRVAITPRVDRPLLPETAYGEEPIPAKAGPAGLARHPGLPAATLDLRYCSRAVRCDTSNSGAHTTHFAGQAVTWRQVNRHGVPCAAGSYQDVSPRTVDLRTPAAGRGYYHPRRTLLILPPPEGHCSAQAASMNWHGVVQSINDAGLDNPLELSKLDGVYDNTLRLSTGSIVWNGQTLPLISFAGIGDKPVKVLGLASFKHAAVYRFENLWLDNTVQIDEGAAVVQNCAARHLKVLTAEQAAPVIDARACLFNKLEAARGLVRLEYATVLDTLLAECLEASDSLLLPALRKDTVDNDVPAKGCIRYSRLFHLPEPAIPALPPDPNNPLIDNDPLWRSQGRRSALRCFAKTCTADTPLFWNTDFGQPGCGVLRPDAKPMFQSGAEDGGEMGACHDYRYAVRQKAVLEKLQEFLPVGMEAVLVADPSLACPPPKAIKN